MIIDRVKKLEEQLGSLALELEVVKKELAEKPKIDLPVDTLIEVDFVHEMQPRYYAGNGLMFCNGTTSITAYINNPKAEKTRLSHRYRPLTGPIVFWEGGECPIPDGVEVKVWHHGGSSRTAVMPFAWASNWSVSGAVGDIIAYQIQESS